MARKSARNVRPSMSHKDAAEEGMAAFLPPAPRAPI
jgi:hypothetical protein